MELPHEEFAAGLSDGGHLQDGRGRQEDLDVVFGNDDFSRVGKVDQQGEGQRIQIMDRHLLLVLLHQVVCTSMKKKGMCLLLHY